MAKYQHSGVVPPLGALQTVAIGTAAAVLLGMIYAFTFYYIPYVYLNLLLAVGFGCGVGYVVGWSAREGNIRNTPVTVSIALLASLVGIYAEWGSCLYAMCPIGEFKQLWDEAGLATFLPHNIIALMLDLFENGSWGLTEGQMVTGWTLVVMWLIEGGVIVVGAMTVAFHQIADRPFCEACHAWITGEAPHLYVGDGSEIVWREVQAGEFDTLADTLRATGNEPTYMRLKLHACDTCEGSSYLTISRCENTVDQRGNPKTVEKDVVTNLAITSTQVELIRAANLIAPTAEEAELQSLATREWTTRTADEQAAEAQATQPAAAAPLPAAAAPPAANFWQTS